MGFLERIGLARKPSRRLGSFELQRRRAGTVQEMERSAIAVRFGLFFVLVGMVLMALPQLETYEVGARVRAGDVWQREEVIAPFSFSIFKTEERLEAERDSIRYDEPPVFARDESALARTETRLDTFEVRVQRVLSAYATWQESRARGDAQAAADSARYASLVDGSNLPLTPAQWDGFVSSYMARQSSVAPVRGPTATGPPAHDRVFGILTRVVDMLLPLGVLDVPKDSVFAEQVAVIGDGGRTESLVPRSNVFGLNEAVTLTRNELSVAFENEAIVAAGLRLFEDAMRPSLIYQVEDTETRWAEREARLSPTEGLVQEGEAIVRRGDFVTPAIQQRLESLARVQAEQRGGIGPYRLLFGQFLLAAAALLIFFMYLHLLRPQIFVDTRHVVLIGLLLAVAIGFIGVAVRLPGAPTFAVPIVLASILLTVIFDSRVGMFATVTIALLGGLVFGYDFEFVFATTVAGVTAVFSLRDVRNRSQIVMTAGLVFLAYALILGGFTLLRASDFSRLFFELMLVGINVIFLLLAYPFLWIFERAFGVTTDLTLLELSDTNRPLLKELSLRAPGSFNHSLQVANLAEAAADATGNNSLLTRVGALYHDIGKMLKPAYYIENQGGAPNPHDSMKPYMSALVIAEHVKSGEELGRQHGLPSVVLDFITTHHGTALMEYFYRKAQDQAGPNDAPVDEREFRYPGPRPQTNEQGLVMLADSVEAACRSIDQPSTKRMESMIDAIFRARMEDGQLSDTQLTFADLEKAKAAFLSILGGIHHVRVRYPGQTAESAEDVANEPDDESLSAQERATLD